MYTGGRTGMGLYGFVWVECGFVFGGGVFVEVLWECVQYMGV